MKLKTLHGKLDSHATIFGLPRAVAASIANQCTFTNPAWVESKMRSGGMEPYGIEQYLRFAWHYPDSERGEVILERGAFGFFNGSLRKLMKLVKWEDRRVSSYTTFPTLRVKLNAEQQQCYDAVRCTKTMGGCYSVVASTSVGKTILLASIAELLEQKTLVVVPTDLILRGWQADLVKAFGFAAKDLGLIKQEHFRFSEKTPFTLASLQTLHRRKNVWSLVNEEFGTVIMDECHLSSAPSYFDFLSQSPAKFRLGATATDRTRKDRTNYHMTALFDSPVVRINTYHKETEHSMPISEVKCVETDFYSEVEVSETMGFLRLMQETMQDEARNELIVRNVVKEWQQGRSVLVTSRLREHVALLLCLLQQAGVENVNEVTGTTNAQRRYTSQLLRMVDKRKVTCLVGTNSAIQTGANLPKIDSVHLALPIANKNNLEQLLGRIRRKSDGKEEATMTYYLDVRTPYLQSIFRRIAQPVFQKMNIPGYQAPYKVIGKL